MSDNDSAAGFVVGLVVGAAIGVALGVLYAPRPGKETRGLVKERAEGAREAAAEAVRRARGFAVEAKDKAEAKLEEIRG